MNNWKIIPSIVFATVLIFGAGVFTGGLLVNYVKPAGAKKVPARSTPAITTNCPPNTLTNKVAINPPSALPEILSRPFLTRLDDDMHLSPEQHKAVEKIINDGKDDIKKTVRCARLEIREVLTPEQLKLFDNLMKPLNRKPAITNAPVPVPTNSP